MTQITSSNRSEEDQFYQDLDRKRAHQSCCTCQTLAILFGILLVIVLIGVYYSYYLVTHGGIFNGVPKTATPFVDFDTKVKDAKPDENGNLILVITAEEMNVLLNQGLATDQFILKDVQTSITPNSMLVYGTLVKPLNSKVVMTIVPEVMNGQIKMTIKKMSAGKLNIPSFLLDSVSTKMTELVNVKMAKLYANYDIKSVTLETNQITIFSSLKER